MTNQQPDERMTRIDIITAHRPPILLVDDEPHVIEGLALGLRKRFTVQTTTSPMEAINLVRCQPFAAVVADLRMPNVDGVALLREVKLAAPAIARLLLTGQGDLESAAAAVNQASVHAVLLKPCPASDVADAIQRAIASVRSLDGDAVVELGKRAALGTMAGAIGHEIGNLAAAFGGTIEALHEQTMQGEVPTNDDVALLGILNTRLIEHARGLRELSKPRPLRLGNLDVAQVVVETVGLLQKAGVLRMVPVHTDLPPISPLAIADRSALESILVNLLKNATDAVESKILDGLSSGQMPGASRISVRVKLEESTIRLEIEDTGCGIARDRLPRIFEPHQSTKGTRGTGLGLGIVRAAVERQSGTIDVLSTIGAGTTVCISLPRAHGPGR